MKPQTGGQRIEDWLQRLGDAHLPVLSRTLAAVEALRDKQDLQMRDLWTPLYADPALCINLIRVANQHRHRHLDTRITTADQALMMLGLDLSVSTVLGFSDVESRLSGKVLQGYMHACSSAYHQSVHAHRWAAIRQDVLPAEIRTATLLRPLAALALWEHDPESMLRVRDLRGSDGRLQTDAEYVEMGFTSSELGAALVLQWRLPHLVLEHLLPDKVVGGRTLGMILASRLDAVAGLGWKHPETERVIAEIAAYLGLEAEETALLIHDTATQALEHSPVRLAPEWATLTDAPDETGTHLPQYTQPAQFCLLPQRQSLVRLLAQCRTGEDERTRKDLQQKHTRVDAIDVPISLALRALHHGAGLQRTVFLLADVHGERLQPYMSIGGDSDPSLIRLSVPIFPGSPLSALLADGKAHWLRPAQIKALKDGPYGKAYRLMDNAGAFVAPVRQGARLLGLLFADRRTRECALDEHGFSDFCQTAAALTDGLDAAARLQADRTSR
ncbi:MAG: HDOD domain-containing protein [Ectothiorhodospiraceae bacterium]|nr:HDOD domain-containing protein [Ectothiorhodospiraceae bacterium]